MLQFKMSHYSVPLQWIEVLQFNMSPKCWIVLSAAVLIIIPSKLTFNEFNTKNRDFTKDCTNLYQKYFVKSEFLKMNWFWTFLNVCRSSDRKCCHIEITISVLQKYTLHLFHVHNVYCTKPALNEPFTFIGIKYIK